MVEEWHDIPGYEGRFQASSLGRVRSLRVLEGHIKTTGYKAVSVKTDSSDYVHALVAAAFLGPRPAGYDINHKDGVKTHNEPSNLEYVTRKENNHHAYKIGLNHHPLTDEQMDLVSDMFFVQGKSYSEIARSLKVNKPFRYRIKIVRSVIGIWRAKDRKGRKNPYEFKLTAESAYQLVKMYKEGDLSQKQVARAFNVHPAHVSRVVSGILHPSALKRYQAEQDK